MNLRAFSENDLREMSLEDFAKALAICLADECAYNDADAAEASLVVLNVAADRLNIADELNDADSLGGYGFGIGESK